MRRVAMLAVAAVLALPGTAPAAQAGDGIGSYDVQIDVLPSGRIHVVETIDYTFGIGLPRHGIYRNIPVRFRYDADHDRVYPLRNVEVTGSPGTPVGTDLSTEGNQRVIRIGDPDRTVTGNHRYVISYDVDGALNRFESHDELFWNAVGAEWDARISRVSVTVRAAGAVGEVACYAGPEGSRLACDSARADGTSASFSQRELGSRHALSVVVALPAGYAAKPGPILKERWSAAKAFEPSRLSLGLAVLVLAAGIGAVAYVVWRAGRDRYYAGLTPGLEPAGGVLPDSDDRVPFFGRGATSVEYEPGDGMRPALMGVLLDEQADPLDVTATIIDLAVRRYLKIEELPRKGLFRRRDWRLTYLGGSSKGLARWESMLLAALFESGETVDVSDLKNKFHTHLRQIQQRLYEDVVARGWFTRRPDRVRGLWFGIGIGAVAAGGGIAFLLARYTRLGIAGLAFVVVGLVLLALHRRMPFRTARGTAALDRARAFRRYLVTAESEQLRFEEREGIFARFLPYAVVLGATEQWAKAFKDIGEQDLYWFSGPSGWSAIDFSDSMSSFSTMTAGMISATPSSASGGSGFGGGGSAGGGGGGGGGGSW